MNEPSESNMLFGALVPRADAPRGRDTAAGEVRRLGGTAFAVVVATLVTLAWVAVSVG